MKKIIFLLLLVTMLSSFIGTGAQDAEPEKYSSEFWEAVANNTGWTITAYHGNEAAPEIPSMIEDKPVTQLGKEVFKNNFSLETAEIPDSITAIGSGAFFGCSGLKDVRLPQSLKRIEANTFQYCINLEHIDIPFTVTFIGNFAFADCIQLKEILLISVTSIGESAFDNCQMLESVFVSSKLVTLGTHAFRDTAWLTDQIDEFVFIGKGILIKWNGTGSDVELPIGTISIVDAFEDKYILESVSLPKTVTQIGTNAFKNAVNLASINFPEYLTSIGVSAFENCRSLVSVELPDSTATIGNSAFRYCEKLTTFAFPPQVTAIGSLVLGDCRNLTDVIIPRSAVKIDTRAFQGSDKVVLNVPINSASEQFAADNQLKYTYGLQKSAGFIYRPEEDGIRIMKYTGNVFDVEIPAVIDGLQVTSVSTAAFQNNNIVRSIHLPLTIKTIGDWAFSYMESLESVQLPLGLNSLGSNVFTGSTALKEIRIPQNLKSIGSEPFDSDTQTKICAAENSETADSLKTMGYEILPYYECAEDNETTVLREELKILGILTSASECDCIEPEKISEDGIIIRIPDGITELTDNVLGGVRGSLMLVIPSDVTLIDEQILTDREITIIGTSGSAAEEFAKEHGIKFLVMLDTLLNIQ